MLKIIITTLLVMTSFQIFGSDYIVKVSNEVTSETAILKASSENELRVILNEINMNDNFKIHFIKAGNQTVDGVKKGGGEGGTD